MAFLPRRVTGEGIEPRFLVPEVVQTSGMDCGPACLKALMEGFRIPVDYGRLREACQTSIDGTSIDTLEDIAVDLGLDAEQVMLPAEHLWVPEAHALPALLVVQRADGFTHFVVAWRLHLGRWIQVMDPARGRRWISIDDFHREVYLHELRVSAKAWSEWARSDDFLGPLGRRIGALGLGSKETRRIQEAIAEDSGWKTAATWDAATRMVEDLIRQNALRPGGSAARLVAAFADSARGLSRESIPECFWSVSASGETLEDGDEELIYRGAVLIRAKGPASKSSHADPGGERPFAALPESPPSAPASRVLQALGEEARAWPRLAMAVALATTAILAEAILFRGLLDLESQLAPGIARWITILLLVAFVAGNRVLVLFADLDLRRLGRRLEASLRMRWSDKLSRIEPGYFRSRPVSDTAERAHRLHRVHDIPASASRLLRAVVEVALTSAGMIWIHPEMALVILATAVFAVLLPFIALPWLAERDLKIQTHNGALSRFVLEALQGQAALRGHGAEGALRYEHDEILSSWGGARYRFAALHGLTEGIQIAAVLASVIWIVSSYVTGGHDPAGVLLLAYWGVTMPFRGREVIYANLSWAGQRSLLLRVHDLLDSPERSGTETDSSVDREKRPGRPDGVVIVLERVDVMATGNRVLEGLDFEVPAGAHVAIVGASGAGKSTLLRLLLGLHLPAIGEVRVDGQPLDAGRQEILRKETAWVDPTIRIWNRSLLDNLAFGAPSRGALSWSEIVRLGDLEEILDHLPDGLQTVLGDAGGRLSGGEGQRVRLARALAKTDARLVLLDEPFRGLDRSRRSRLLDRVRGHWKKATLLCVTHDVSETLRFDRVLVLEKGKLVEDGCPRDLAEQDESRFAGLLRDERAFENEMKDSSEWTRYRAESGRTRRLGQRESAS